MCCKPSLASYGECTSSGATCMGIGLTHDDEARGMHGAAADQVRSWHEEERFHVPLYVPRRTILLSMARPAGRCVYRCLHGQCALGHAEQSTTTLRRSMRRLLHAEVCPAE